MDPSINATQAAILRRMFEQDGLRFSQINTAKLPTDVFSYHLRQLIKAKLIEKLPDQTYRLTFAGKRRTDVLYPSPTSYIQQGFISVLLTASQQRDGQEVYLAHTRNIVPSKGKVGLIAAKVRYGEDTMSAAKRALDVQTGLTGELTLRSIWHSVDKVEGEIVDDRYFFVYEITNFHGELKRAGLTGENRWMTLQEMKNTGNMFPGVDKFIESTKSDQITYHERFTEGESI